MNKELYLFIIWQNARHKEIEIIEDISKKFDIIQSFGITWPKMSFIQKLSLLYSKNLFKAYNKAKKTGMGEFIVITAYDNNPVYKDKKNFNILLAKSKYRELTGGGHLVHASDHPEETEKNLISLLGLTAKEFETKYQTPWNGETIRVNAAEFEKRSNGHTFNKLVKGFKSTDTMENIIRN